MIPANYVERVYAGILGKNIGVRLGAPVEPLQWTYERIRDVFGENIHGYLRHYGIFGADDDSTGPAYFYRVLEEKDDPQMEDFARAWVDYVREGKGFFWWGGGGISPSHICYRMLASGQDVKVTRDTMLGDKKSDESVGGQIFVDYFGLAYPGNEKRAAEIGGRLAALTHVNEGLWGGMFMAAASAAAFDAKDTEEIVRRALATIPQDSDYARVTKAVMAFHKENPDCWQDCRAMLEKEWGYDRYSGICPMIPNAGVCIMALLYSGGNFCKGIEISAMAGWDTDCNAGNVGVILGVFEGLQGIDPCYRDPFHDVSILSGVSGDINICDMPSLACRIARRGYELAGETAPEWLIRPDQGLYFDFELPGATHGFQVSRGFVLQIANSTARPYKGKRSLQVIFNRIQKGLDTRLYFKTFYTRPEFEDGRYSPVFAPKACPGQIFSMQLFMDQWTGAQPLRIRPYVRTAFDEKDYEGEDSVILNHQWNHLSFPLPQVDGGIISEVGLKVISDSVNTGEPSRDLGLFFLDEVRVSGPAAYPIDFGKCRLELGNLTPFAHNRGQWAAADGKLHGSTNEDTTQIYTGAYEARDLIVSCDVTPVKEGAALMVRALGTLRHVLAGFTAPGKAGIRQGSRQGYATLCQADFPWEAGRTYRLSAAAEGENVALFIDGKEVCRAKVGYDHGMFGLALPGNGEAVFENLEVTEK